MSVVRRRDMEIGGQREKKSVYQQSEDRGEG